MILHKTTLFFIQTQQHIACTAQPLTCLLCTPNYDHVSYYNWAIEHQEFFLWKDWGTEYVNDFVFFDAAVGADDNDCPIFGGCLPVMRDCAIILQKWRLFIFGSVILLNVINALHNTRSIKPKKILCHYFFNVLDNPHDDISISTLLTLPIKVL